MAKHKLRLGYIGTSIASYYAGEHQQRARAIAGLEKLAGALDFELIAIADEVMTEEDSRQAAANYLQLEGVNA